MLGRLSQWGEVPVPSYIDFRWKRKSYPTDSKWTGWALISTNSDIEYGRKLWEGNVKIIEETSQTLNNEWKESREWKRYQRWTFEISDVGNVPTTPTSKYSTITWKFECVPWAETTDCMAKRKLFLLIPTQTWWWSYTNFSYIFG